MSTKPALMPQFLWDWLAVHTEPYKPSEKKLPVESVQALRDLEKQPGWAILLREYDTEMSRIHWKAMHSQLSESEMLRLRILFSLFGAPMSGVPGDLNRQGTTLIEGIVERSDKKEEEEFDAGIL